MPDVIPETYARRLAKHGFTLQKRLGGGSFGTVYQASQSSLAREVAVKFFDSKFSQTAENRQRFQREALLLARVQHPGIPYVLTVGEVPETKTPYTVMQLVTGSRLDEELAERRKLPVREAIGIAMGLASALEAAHQAKVIHRDIKPDNVIISDGRPFLIDFSIGVCLEYEPGLTRATRRGDRVGVADYASPEQVKDSSAVDHRTDIYSLGVLLFEMATGNRRLLLPHLEADLGAEKDILAPIIQTACAQQASARFETAESLSQALSSAMRSLDSSGVAPIAICPNPVCQEATRSEGKGYLRGPRVLGATSAKFCECCRSRLKVACDSCGKNLPTNVGSLLTTQSRATPDRLVAYCSNCSAVLYTTPTCGTCGSLLLDKDFGTDTKTLGCTKCRAKSERERSRLQAEATPINDDLPYQDEDIPF